MVARGIFVSIGQGHSSSHMDHSRHQGRSNSRERVLFVPQSRADDIDMTSQLHSRSLYKGHYKAGQTHHGCQGHSTGSQL